MRFLVPALLICALAAVSTPTWSEVGDKDLQIAARALGFSAPPLRGAVRVGIVYAPGVPASAAQAAALREQLGDGLRVGSLVLVPVMLKLGETAGGDIGLLFLTEGLGGQAAALPAVIRSRQIPCVTLDLQQVRSGNCMMGVRSQPKIEILVNRKAAADSGVSFAAAFRMMITEI